MITIIKYTPQNRGHLLATFSVCIPQWAGMQIHDLCLWSKNNHRWVTFPSKTIKDENDPNKRTYSPYIVFPDAETQKRFQTKSLEQLDAYLNPSTQPGKITQLEMPLFTQGIS